MNFLLVATACLAVAEAFSNTSLHTRGDGIGDQMWRAYGVYDSIPVTASDATSKGWAQISGSCEPGLGVAMNYDNGGEHYPLNLYFTPAGEMTGVGVYVYGAVKQNLVDKGFWIKQNSASNDDLYYLTVTFRSAAAACSSNATGVVLGDRLVINQPTLAYSLPLSNGTAESAGFVRGSCFSSMGHHYFKDLTGSLTWEAANLLPVVPMMNHGTINAIFFASSTVQQTLGHENWWEPIPLINTLMCKNWCDSSCTFHDTHIWSTMHVYFSDYKQVTCPGGCTIACC